MDVHEFHSQIYDNYTRLAPNNNGGGPGRINKLAHYPPEHEDRAHARITPTTNSNAMDAAADLLSSDDSMIRGWHDSSRIFRVSRAFGGKDRHTKVLTSKGLRDRRVRLSVSTAIQFYDLQDRLGYDQPSRAIEWLINAAADSIGELPSLQAPFPETPRQVYHAKLGFESASLADGDTQQQNGNKNRSMSKSASSTSETSKTDVRVNQRVKAGERAREREFECECKQAVNVGERGSPTANPITHPSASSSLTELLIGATGGNQSGSSPNSTPMIDCFTNAGLISSSATARHSLSSHHHACSFLGQTQMGNSVNIPAAFHLTTGDHHHQQQQQQEHDVQHFNSLTGYINWGTLQSNTPSTASPLLHHNLQRYASSMEGSNLPAFFMTTAATSSMGPNQHHFPTGLNGGLNLYCGDGENSDYKGKK